jgi:asparaginyl-tRNA synthetase
MKINKILKDGNIDDTVIVSGWVLTCRKQKNMSFIKCTDGSNTEGIQLIWEGADEVISSKIHTGCSIKANGKLVESPGKGQSVEVQVSSVEIIGCADPDDYPLAKTKMNLDTLRNYIHLRTRTATFGNVFRIKSAITQGTHQFFKEEEYFHLDPNIITINECEGGAGVFQLTEHDLSDVNKLPTKDGKYDWNRDHFGKPVFLTVSSQLQLEAISCALGSVYTTNKSFRSEHSSTYKHVSEFTHLEIEDIFIELNDLMNIGERYIKYLANYLLETCSGELECLNKFTSKGIVDRVKEIKDATFHRITHRDAIELLQTSDMKEKPQHEDDLSSQAENWLTDYFKGPVFVTHWPISIKSFYMRQCDDGTCESFDLLMPYKIGELIGGSMREENYDKLLSMMAQKGVDETKLKFYTDLRKFGTVPHGGFGLGVDRLCMMFTGMENIKDVIPFPVQYKNCDF